MVGRTQGRASLFSERAFHRWISRNLPAGSSGLLPLGDDVAALPLDRERVLLLTTDALSEGTHFLRRSPPDAVGAAAIAASLSDIAAKGGRPVAALLDLLLPPSTPASWARAVVRGAEAMATRHGCHVVGGDTKPAAGRSVIGTLVGTGRARRLAPRSGARPGDLLVTTGTVGKGGASAWPLSGSVSPTVRELRGMLDIRPRVAEGATLVGDATAMVDTSDGIGEAARLIGEASQVQMTLEADRFPLDPRIGRLDLGEGERLRLALFGGDYELLAAVPADSAHRLRRAVARHGTYLTIVGRVERGRGVRLLRGGRRVRGASLGWDPFVNPRPTISSR
jgi:thiamine-monophosphate kinase